MQDFQYKQSYILVLCVYMYNMYLHLFVCVPRTSSNVENYINSSIGPIYSFQLQIYTNFNVNIERICLKEVIDGELGTLPSNFPFQNQLSLLNHLIIES